MLKGLAKILGLLVVVSAPAASQTATPSPEQEFSRVGVEVAPIATVLEVASACAEITKLGSTKSYQLLIGKGWLHAPAADASSPDFSTDGSRVMFLKDAIFLTVGNTDGIKFCRVTARARSAEEGTALFQKIATDLSMANLEETGEVIPLLQRQPQIIKRDHWYNSSNIIRSKFELLSENEAAGLFDILILPFG